MYIGLFYACVQVSFTHLYRSLLCMCIGLFYACVQVSFMHVYRSLLCMCIGLFYACVQVSCSLLWRLFLPHFSAVYGLGFRFRIQDWSLGFRVQGLGFRVQGLGFRVQGLGFRVQVVFVVFVWVILVLGSGFNPKPQGSGFRVQAMWFCSCTHGEGPHSLFARKQHVFSQARK